ncbi:MAG TPA: hypothetical protein VHG89_01495 [Verrucomicrobiae bacterium]|nr:hypothetical protein [Verrucomicrobiae bacterium]
MALAGDLNFDRPIFEMNPLSVARVTILEDFPPPNGYVRSIGFYFTVAWTLLGHFENKNNQRRHVNIQIPIQRLPP